MKLTGKPYLLLLISILCVSTGSIFIRLSQTDANSLAIATYRLTFSGIILLIIAGSQLIREIARLDRKQHLLILLSGVFLALHFITWVTSLEYTSVAISTVLVTTTPIWVTFFSKLFLKLHVSVRFYIGLMLAMLGVGLIALNSKLNENVSFFGLFLAVAGAWMAAGYFVVNRELNKHMSTKTLVAVVYSVAALILLLVSLLARTQLGGFAMKTWVWLLLLAIIPQVLGHSGLNLSLRAIPTHIVTTALLAEPIFASIMAYLIFFEIPSKNTLAGAILILAGVLLAIYSENKRVNSLAGN